MYRMYDKKLHGCAAVVPFFHLFSLVIYMKLTHLNRISHFFIKQWALPDKYIYMQFNVIHVSKLPLQ